MPPDLAAKCRENFGGGHRPDRADRVLLVKHRGGARLVGARHLPGQLLDILRRVARDEQLGFVLMPGQRDIGRRAAPVFGMIEIDLIEGVALALVDRAGIAVAEMIEIRRVEIDRLGLAAVETDGKMGAVDRLDRAGVAVVDAELLVVAGELDAVAGAELKAAVRRSGSRDLPIRARRAPCARRARRR